MRLVALCLLLTFVLSGCGDDVERLPLPTKEAPPTRSYTAGDVVGSYEVQIIVDPKKPKEQKLIDLIKDWNLEMKEDGRFTMKLSSSLEGSYTVARNVLLLTVEKQDGLSLVELERMARKQKADTAFIENLRSFEFRILDNGDNLLAVKGDALEPGAFMFHRSATPKSKS